MRWTPCFTALADARLLVPRFGHCACAIDAREEWGTDLVVIYGGVGQPHGEGPQTALGDVVALQVENASWFAPDVSGAEAPGPRAFHAAAAHGRRLYVFGGHILTVDARDSKRRRVYYNDVWCLDTVEWQWIKLQTADSAAAAPPKRDMACLLAVGDGQLLLFGGRNEQGRALSDTWLFDPDKCVWTQLKPAGATPPARKMHSMVVLGSQVVLFGGEKDNGPLDDLWVLHGLEGSAADAPRWTQIKARSPPQARFGHAMVAVPGANGSPAGRCVLFGGCHDLSGFLSLARNYVQSRDLWSLDMNALSWVQAESEQASDRSPSERMCHSATALPDGRVLLLGGRRKEGICQDVWWLEDVAGSLTQPPSPSAQSTASGSAQLSGTTTPTGMSNAAAAAFKPSTVQPSLLQSLLQPLRPLQPSTSPHPWSEPPSPQPKEAAAGGPRSGQQETATANGPSSASHPHFQQQQGQQQQQQQQHQQPPPASSSSSERPPRASIPEDSPSEVPSSSGDWAPWRSMMALPNPLAFTNPLASVAAKQLSSSLLTAGNMGRALLQQGGMLSKEAQSPGRTPWNIGALSRLAPSFLGSAYGTTPGAVPGPVPPLADLRSTMGLPAAPAPPPAKPNVLQGLAALGQALLSEQASPGGTAGLALGPADVAPEVLLAAARQRLMAAPAEELQLREVQLLLTDLQAMAAAQCADALYGRLREGGGRVAGQDVPVRPFMHTTLDGLLIAEVPALQQVYHTILEQQQKQVQQAAWD